MPMRSKDSLGDPGKATLVGGAVGYALGSKRRQERELRRIRKAVEGERPKANAGGTLAAFLGMVFWIGAICAMVMIPVFGWFALVSLFRLSFAELGGNLLVVLVCSAWVALAYAVRGLF